MSSPLLRLLPALARGLLVMGAALIIVGLGLAGETWRRTLEAVEVQGEVVDLLPATPHHTAPLVRFKTESGGVIGWRVPPGHAADALHTGDKVTIYYPLANPQAAVLGTPRALYAIPTFIATAGLFLALIGATTKVARH